MAHEAIDRHLTRGRRNKLALIYTDKEHTERFTFEDMSLQSNRFANVLRKLGVGKGDRVFVFLGRRPELYIAILGILKIGAIPSPLFEAFMEDAVRDRMANAEAVALGDFAGARGTRAAIRSACPQAHYSGGRLGERSWRKGRRVTKP